MLADYAEVYSFSLPPGTVVVTSGLVCDAEGPDLVAAAVARQIAHLESRDVSRRVAEGVDWRTPLELARGDTSRLRESMLDFADPKRAPRFTSAQDSAAEERANAMLLHAKLTQSAGQDLAAVNAKADGLRHGASKGVDGWSTARAEACELIGR